MPEFSPIQLDDEHLLLCSVFFDAGFYASKYDLCGLSERQLVRHYLGHGWVSGHDPSEHFSSQWYLDYNRDVQAAGVNPLLHYLKFGRREGRAAASSTELFTEAYPPAKAPEESDWHSLVPRAQVEGSLRVIVPVYLGFNETLRCIFSVLAAPVESPFDLLVVDDSTPDGLLQAKLEQLAARGLFRLERTASNLGFVGACNLGLRLSAGRDVIVLNADAEVYNDWIDRFCTLAGRDRSVGTITPLTNNGEIASYPNWCQNNWRRLEIGDAELDALLKSQDLTPVEVPTGVGFCMFIRAECIDQVGLLDEGVFNRGYGEENDFCQRALRLGWTNVLATNIFVRHRGSVSFGAEKFHRIRSAIDKVIAKHPSYEFDVQTFIKGRPLDSLYRTIDICRILRIGPGPRILFVAHSRGGGTLRHIEDMSELLAQEDVSVVRCEPVHGGFRLFSPAVPDTPALMFLLKPGVLTEFGLALEQLGIEHIHVHSILDFDAAFIDVMREAAERLDVSYDYTFHDYAPICPRIDFCDGIGNYCGEPSTDQCDICVSTYGAQAPVVSTKVYREKYAALLHGARNVYAPGIDVLKRIEWYLPGCHAVLRRHPEGKL